MAATIQPMYHTARLSVAATTPKPLPGLFQDTREVLEPNMF